MCKESKVSEKVDVSHKIAHSRVLVCVITNLTLLLFSPSHTKILLLGKVVEGYNEYVIHGNIKEEWKA